MLISVRGHVEADPMRVPLPATMGTAQTDTFADVLQERLVADRDANRRGLGERKNADEPVAETVAPPAEPEVVERERAEPPVGDDAFELAEEAVNDGSARPFELQDTTRRGEPERQETAGKGADSPRAYSRPSEQVLATVLHQQTPTSPTAPPIASAGNGIGAVTAAKATGTSTLTRAAGLDAQLPNVPARSQSVAGGYRTNSAASAQMLDQARDSIFKQILLQLTDDGGEMRLRLEPPDLGELDLRLSVEGGNRLHLSISAERGDLAHLLQKHLDELKQTLQDAGLDVAGAHVETRSEGQRRSLQDTDFGGSSADDIDAADAAPQPRMGGYVTAEGLDYWA